MPQTIFKILTASQLATVRSGGLMQAPVDIADGYVHFSTAKQVQETLTKWFSGQKDLSIASVDGEAFGPAFKWETSRGGDYFPHVYAEVRQHHIIQLWPIVDDDGSGAPLAPAAVTSQPEPSSKPDRTS